MGFEFPLRVVGANSRSDEAAFSFHLLTPSQELQNDLKLLKNDLQSISWAIYLTLCNVFNLDFFRAERLTLISLTLITGNSTDPCSGGKRSFSISCYFRSFQ